MTKVPKTPAVRYDCSTPLARVKIYCIKGGIWGKKDREGKHLGSESVDRLCPSSSPEETLLCELCPSSCIAAEVEIFIFIFILLVDLCYYTSCGNLCS